MPPGAPDQPGDFGDRAVQLADLAGLNLDPWQQLVLRAMLRTAPGSSQWAAYESLILVPRQNGKSVTLEAFDLAKLFLSPPGHMIMHTAHLFPTAVESFRHLTGLIRNCPELWAEVAKVNNSHGNEGIELTNGSRLRFAARGVNGAGRGFSPDDVVFDEAYRLPPEAEEALLYAISAKPNPQLVYASSTGFPDSHTLWSLVERGRMGDDASLMLAEWSSDPALDLEDEGQFWDAVRQANPALGYRLDERKTLAEYRKALSQGRLEGYGRERLGLWAATGLVGVISPTDWAATEAETAGVGHVSAFAIATDLDRAWSAIGLAGPHCNCEPPVGPCDPGLTHIELVDHARGTGWIVARCVELNRKHGPARFVLDGGGPLASLKDEMEAAGLELVVTSTRDVAASFGLFMDALKNGTLRHGPQQELTDAVRSAQARTCGADGGQAFGRKASGSDITPLEVVSLAHWAAVTQPRLNVLNSIW